MLTLDNENSAKHWEFIDVNNKIVLDLGCGRWNKVERVEDSWLTTPEHFIVNGAKKVIGVDIDNEEIEWFKHKFTCDNRYEFVLKYINSSEDLLSLYNTHNPDCVKVDIETGERFLLNLDKDQFRRIEQYYIETHGNDLYHYCLDKLVSYNYHIVEQIDLTHTNGYCKAIFAKRL